MIGLVLPSYSTSLTVSPTVPPAELEGTLLKHPEVADSAVVGVVVNDLELPRYLDPREMGVVETKLICLQGLHHSQETDNRRGHPEKNRTRSARVD